MCAPATSPTKRFETLKLGYIGIRISICNINGLLIRRSLMMRLSVAPQRMLPYPLLFFGNFQMFQVDIIMSTLHWINNVGRWVSISIFSLKSCFFPSCMKYFVRCTLNIFIFIKLFNVKFMSYWIFFRYNATVGGNFFSLVVHFPFVLFFFYQFCLVRFGFIHIKTVSI